MMKLGKVLLAAALLSSVVTTMSAQAASTAVTKKLVVQQLPLKFTFDQVKLAPAADQSGFSYNNMVYVPLRFASYALNKAVTWDGKNNAVKVSVPTKQQLIVIGEYNLNRQVRGAGTGTTVQAKPIALNVTVQKLKYVFDGVAKQPAAGQEGIIYKGTLYVPIRFFSQAIGKDVAWDAKTLTVAVSVKKETDGETGSGTGTTNPGTTVPSAPLTVDQQAINAFNSLKNSSEATFNSLFNQYMSAKTDEEKAKIKADGKAQLAAITSQFNQLVATYQEKGASASVIAEAKTQFSLLSSL